MTRVKDFATTRTAPLTDEFIGIDSLTGGTAKMTFADAALNVRNVRTGTAAPNTDADFIGQTFVKTNATLGVWKSVNVGAGAADWIQVWTDISSIADGALSGVKLTNATVVGSDKLTDASVTNAKLATGIDGAKLTAASVPTSALTDTPITSPLSATLNANNQIISNASLVGATCPQTTCAIVAGVLTIPFEGTQTVTVNSNITSFTFSGYPATGQFKQVNVEMIVDGTGGRTVTGFDSKIKWANNDTVPTLTTTANKMDIWSFYTVDGGTSKIRGFVVGTNSTP